MAKGDLLGHIDCPMHDGFEMDVKEDKNGNPYAFCPDCCTQILTHGREPKASLMLRRMRPVKPADDDKLADPPPPVEDKGIKGAIEHGDDVTVIAPDYSPQKIKSTPKKETKSKPTKKTRSGFEGMFWCCPRSGC